MKWPVKIIVSGNKDVAYTLIGRAQQKMNVTIEEAGFRDLKQYSRVFRYDDGSVIQCLKNHNYYEISIFVPKPESKPLEQMEAVKGLYLIYGYRQTITSTAPETAGEKIYRHYSSSYKQREISTTGRIEDEQGTFLRGPTDKKYTSDVTEEELNFFKVGREWSKTYEGLTVTAYISQIVNIPVPPIKTSMWAISATFNGALVDLVTEGKQQYPQTGILRAVETPETTAIYMVNFDIGKNADGVYKIGLINAESDSFTELSLIDGMFQVTRQKSLTIRHDVFPNNPLGRESLQVIGFGYNEQTDTWEAYYANFYWQPYIYRVHITTGGHSTISGEDPDSFDGGFLCASVWNPLTRTLYPIWASEGGYEDGGQEYQHVRRNIQGLQYRHAGYYTGIAAIASYNSSGVGTGYGLYEPYYPKNIGYSTQTVTVYINPDYITIAAYHGPAVAAFGAWMPEGGNHSNQILRQNRETWTLGYLKYADRILDRGGYTLLSSKSLWSFYLNETVYNPGVFTPSAPGLVLYPKNTCEPNGRLIIHTGNSFNPQDGRSDQMGLIVQSYHVPLRELEPCDEQFDASVCMVACRSWHDGEARNCYETGESTPYIPTTLDCSSEESPAARLTPPPSEPEEDDKWCDEPDGSYFMDGNSALEDYLEKLFPWDRNWRAILLKGQTADGEEVPPMVVFEKSPLQGAFDEDADAYPRHDLLLIDGNGNTWELGQNNRAFFTQVNFGYRSKS